MVPTAHDGTGGASGPVDPPAAALARRLGWSADADGRLRDAAGVPVARSLPHAAAAMVDLGWLDPREAEIAWDAVPEMTGPSVATALVRAFLDTDGRHPAAG
jgi:hypothetical protein